MIYMVDPRTLDVAPTSFYHHLNYLSTVTYIRASEKPSSTSILHFIPPHYTIATTTNMSNINNDELAQGQQTERKTSLAIPGEAGS